MFTKAIRTQKKLRLAIDGPSGSGKTMSALLIAKGLGSKIALIDTERGSASLYADLVEFDSLALDYFSVDNYVKAIGEAIEAGYEVLIIDSLSHAWAGTGGVLDSVSGAGSKGSNSFADWGKIGTPQQNRLMDTILKAPLHVIVTMRVKTDYDVEKDERGKAVPKKIGLAPVQRDGVSYEFDIYCSMNSENRMTVEKTRMVSLASKFFDKPGEEFGKTVSAWLNSGAPVQPKINPDDVPAFRRILSEEVARIDTWAKADNSDLVRDRAAIIECYKAVKGVAASIGLEQVVTENPATQSMSAKQILDAAAAIAKACDTALPQAQ